MNQLQCTRCGAFNPSDAPSCTQCGVSFSSTPYVDAVISEPQPWTAQTPGGPLQPARQAEAGAYGHGQVDRDEEHLRLLGIFHYIYAALVGLVSCIPIFHLVIGIGLFIVGLSSSGGDGGPPAVVGLIFAGIAALIIGLGWTFAFCLYRAGKHLREHTSRTFCLVVAAISCFFMPLGTILGVFTLIVLLRPSVQALFEDR